MKKLALLALLACAGASFAQPVPAGWVQPWTPKLPAWESRVISCREPVMSNRIAADDFRFGLGYTFTQINWWGTIAPTPTVDILRPYYIAIYKDGGACFPAWDSIVWSACVYPDTRLVGTDCEGQQVYKFFSNHAPVTLGPGRYWIQISESDRGSATPGAIDFEWSSHSPANDTARNCPALQMTPRAVIQPLIEPCYQTQVDLAFEIL